MVAASAYFATKFNDDDIFSYWEGSLGYSFGFNIVGALFIVASTVAMALQVLFATNSRNVPK